MGVEAEKAAEFEPERVARFAKRDMGEALYHKRILGRRFPPEIVQALILKKLKRDAKVKLDDFKQAVITVPAYFTEPRRKATQDAGRLAGLEVLDIINEPTAAAISYGVQQGFISEDGEATSAETVLVYDLGGGTFDVTLMEIDGLQFNAVATAGDVHLGGIDWDERIVEFLAKQFEMECGVDLRENALALEMLRREAMAAKHSLTARDETLARLNHEGKRAQIQLTRDGFESLTADLLERTRMTVKRLLKGCQDRVE